MSRAEVDKNAPVAVRRPPGGSEIIAVGGGKGGIGKSMLSANLGLSLAALGQRVVLFDADLGGANLHSCLGMDPPRATISEFLDKKRNSLDTLLTKTPFANVSLVSGALDDVNVANPRYSQKLRLLKEVARFDADYVVIDLGAGTSFNTLDFFLIADLRIVSILPEPTSIENAYRFVKAAFFRRLKNLEHAHGLHKVVERIMQEKDHLKIRTPADLVNAMVAQSPKHGRDIAIELKQFGFKLVVNMVRSQEDLTTAANVRSACSKYFGIDIELAGTLPYDNAVWQAVRKRQAVIKAFPDAEVAKAVKAIAGHIVAERKDGAAQSPPPVQRAATPHIREIRQ